ncbi:DegV family protein [Clostridiaceae bacterium]|nr:DegV family protein [Clostridiaceae bacterium]RKI07426.1 DegV family protein [bacterium 1XD21-70]
MKYRIVGDSCLDLTEEMRKDSRFQIVPLTLQVDDTMIVDDEGFDQAEFLRLVKESKECPKTACPSPEAFKKAYECEEEDVYVITLSSHLSGSYNSAMVGKSLYEEEHGHKNILIIDSESASSGELSLAMAICGMYEEGLGFEEISRRVLKLRDQQRTYFVLDSLEYLRKNGRLTGLQAFFATALNIKPVMGADHGVIVKLDQARGINKAFARMCETAVRERGTAAVKQVVISHCNAPGRAQQVKEELERLGVGAGIVVTETAGVSTLYAGDGGIILVM